MNKEEKMHIIELSIKTLAANISEPKENSNLVLTPELIKVINKPEIYRDFMKLAVACAYIVEDIETTPILGDKIEIEGQEGEN